jgi:hypothetical protein
MMNSLGIKKFLSRLGLMMLLSIVSVLAQSTSEIRSVNESGSGACGQFVASDGSCINGYLRIRLQGATIKNICTPPPFLIVPTINMSYPIVNGVAQTLASANYLSQDCLTPRIPYYVEVSDQNNQLLYGDNWYIPRPLGGIVDIGALAHENFGGPITVAIPYGIISTPSVNQSITQPVGTSFTFYGTVNFAGTVNYTSTPVFTNVQFTSVGIGVSPGTYPLNVVGAINTSSAYLLGGSYGTLGYYLASGGSGQPDSWQPLPTPGTNFYQTAYNGATALTQRSTFGTDGISLIASDTGGQTVFSLGFTGVTGGTYTYPSSISIGADGRISGIVSGGTPISRTCNAHGCYTESFDGTYTEWGTLKWASAGCPIAGSYGNYCLVVFPIAFPNAVGTVQANFANGAPAASCFATITTDLTTSGFIIGVGSVGPGCPAFAGSETSTWFAVGY